MGVCGQGVIICVRIASVFLAARRSPGEVAMVGVSEGGIVGARCCRKHGRVAHTDEVQKFFEFPCQETVPKLAFVGVSGVAVKR